MTTRYVSAALISRATRSRTHEFSVDPVIVKNDVRLRFVRAEVQVDFFPRVDRRNGALIHRPIFGDMSFWQAVGGKMAACKGASKCLSNRRERYPIKFVVGASRQNRNDMH